MAALRTAVATSILVPLAMLASACGVQSPDDKQDLSCSIAEAVPQD
jgi:hypothetical protein